MIIGVAGPICSGKDSLGRIFAEKGFELISTGDIIREEMRKEGIEITRENLQKFAGEMRKKEGLSYPSNKLSRILKADKNYFVQGFRNDDETREFKKIGKLIALDAPAKLRFERMKARNREKDPTDFDKFLEIDKMELYGYGEKGFGFNIKKCMDMADHLIVNDGSEEDLRKKVEDLLDKIKGS